MASLFRSEQFRLEPVADGVWATFAVPGSGAGGNCGIVDLGGKTLVFDTSRTPQAARDLRSAAKMCTGRDPSIVVNSHWHPRHTGGNGVFRGSTIYGTPTTRHHLSEIGPGLEASVADESWELATAELRLRCETESDPRAISELREQVAGRDDLRRGLPATGVLPPNEAFDSRHRFPGPREVLVVEGRGHSESDSVLWVGDSETLFTGDLVSVGTHPSLHSGSLALWNTALDRIDAIGPKIIVPGHGPLGDPRAVAKLRRYFAYLESLATGDDVPPLPAPFDGWGSPSRFAANLRVLRGAGKAPVAGP
jgi:cyclase